MKKPVVVSILNQRLTLRSDADEGHISEVAGFVEAKVQEVMKQSRAVLPLTAVLLACLNITDEFFRYRQGRAASSSRAARKVQDLIGVIEEQFSDGGQSGWRAVSPPD